MKTGLYSKAGVLVEEKSLQWLPKHKYEVTRIDIQPGVHEEGVRWCTLAATLSSGLVFKAYFYSRVVCEQFVAARKCWRGL